jgi:polyhydroxyalkanoate synthesis repressor PhaR
VSFADQGPAGGPADPEPATIIRYPNRRLYDKSQGRYVTLRDVEEKVRRGGTVVVRDSKTGEDLTRTVLTQIILEQHPERMNLFPVSFLHLVIRANTTLLGFLRDYVRQSLAYAEMLQRAAPLNPLAVPGEWMQAFLPGSPPRSQPEATPPPEAPPDSDALARRVADLERRLEELQASAGKPGPAAASGRARPQRGGPSSRGGKR